MTIPPLPEAVHIRRNAHGFTHSFSHLQMDAYGRECAQLALDALLEYANPNNWDEDFHGVKRKWLEPDSSTRNAYSGFELAQKAIKEAGVQ